MAALTSLERYEVGGYVGRCRPRVLSSTCCLGEGDVVRARDTQDDQTFALKRIEVESDAVKASHILADMTRSCHLKPHPIWLPQYEERCFVQEYVDPLNCQRTRCLVLEELAETSMEQEVIRRAAQNDPFPQLFSLWATLLHGLRAFHVQGCLHRDLSPRNLFFCKSRLKLGRPGMLQRPANEGYYPKGLCEAYSADIFALGLVFLEMAVLHQVSEFLVDNEHGSYLFELLNLEGGLEAFRSFLWERCEVLGLALPEEAVVEVLAAMLDPNPSSRPTCDDLLDWPCFGPFANPLEISPVGKRPCVYAAHLPLAEHSEVPTREVLMVPFFHQIFSKAGAEMALKKRKYAWCGQEYGLWWYAANEPIEVQDLSNIKSLQTSPPSHDELKQLATTGSATLPSLTVEAALEAVERTELPEEALDVARAFNTAGDRWRACSHTLYAEVLHRAALAAELRAAELSDPALHMKGPSSRTWLGLAACLFESGRYMAARRCCPIVQNRVQEEEQQAGGVSAAAHESRLFGYCEFFLAADRISTRMASQSLSQADALSALRSTHVSFYYRSTLAVEVGNWEVLAALGEFYRLIGSPDMPPLQPNPDLPTSLSYFEQAAAMVDASAFLLKRLELLRRLIDG